MTVFAINETYVWEDDGDFVIFTVLCINCDRMYVLVSESTCDYVSSPGEVCWWMNVGTWAEKCRCLH